MKIDVLSIFIGLVAGALLVLLAYSLMGKNAKKEAQKVLDEANNQAKNTVKQAVLDGKTQVYDLKLQAEKEIKEKKSEILEQESKLQRREDSLNFRDENLTQKERKLDEKLRKAEDKAVQLDKMEQDLQSRIDGQIALLERVSNMSEEEARKELMDVVETKMADEVAAYIRDKEEEAKEKAAENAREIIATAIQRYSQDESLDRTVSVVTLPSEEMKGRIIGREGRNIRAIEQATGVDLIIDDTPEAITVSCFDPIRREIARRSLDRLIQDGRIHPAHIEKILNEEDKVTEYSRGWPFYKSWIAPCQDPDGAIVGIGACHSFEHCDEVYNEMLSTVTLPAHELNYIEKGFTPYRRPPYTFVADNFVVSGDAACLTKPINGEGVTSSMVHLGIVSEVIAESLKNGDTSKKGLWKINTEYNKVQGADFSFMRALLTGVINAAKLEEFEYAFESGMISDELLSSGTEGGEFDPATSVMLNAVFRMISGIVTGKVSKKTVSAALQALKNAAEIKELYLAFPEEAENYARWCMKADKLWKRIGKLR